MRQITRIFLFGIVLTSSFFPSGIASAEEDYSINIPLRSLNNDQTIQLDGLNSTYTLEFTLPDNWKTTDQSWLEISVMASDLLALSDSSLTISLNGLQLTSLNLQKLVDSDQRVNLPSNFFESGNNLLSFDGMLYLPGDLKTNCIGWDNPARWIYFKPQSILHVAFQKLSLPADLSYFPDNFLQPLDFHQTDEGDNTLFVMPDQIKTDDLNALAATAYFLGHQAGNEYIWNPQILTKSQFDQLSNINNINNNIVFIDNIPVQFETTIATEKNAIGIFSSPWDASKTIMILYDKDREDGYTPAIIFGDWIKKVLLSGNVAYFDRTANWKPPAFKNRYSFEELGYLDRTVRGIGTGDLIYRLYIPYDVDPTSANLALYITHSPDLDNKTTSITVNLNGFTVASILPATQVNRQDPIHVDLPAKRFRVGINFIRISFDLHVLYSSCEKAPESVWASVFNSSTFQLTYRNRISIPVLDDFPAPFNENPSAAFVIPDQLDMQTLAQVSQLVFMIGSSSFYANQPPRILTARDYTASKTKQKNYILVGLPSENDTIREINDFLPQPFKSNSNQLQEGFGVYLPTLDSEASVGLLQIAPSPWQSDGTVLVLTGTDSHGLGWVWNAVLDPKVREQFSGNIMIVGPDKGIVADTENALSTKILFEQTPMVVKIPIIGKFLQQNGQSEEIISLLAIALAGLFTLIALKVAPVLLRLEITPKKHPENSEKEQE